MTAAGVVLLAYGAAQLTWMLVPKSAAPSAAPPLTVKHAAGASHNDVLSLSREIIARHLFGEAQADNAPADAAIPETPLRLVLRGVVASTDPETASAIVADPGGKENFYTVGQELPGGAVLKEVHAQHIVLSRGGRFETLRLPETALKVNDGGAAVRDVPDGRPLRVAPQAGALMQRYRDQFIQDPQSLANLLQGEPYWDNGSLIGYRLRPGRDAGALAQFGIQSGDVVTAVNGVSLTDPAGRMELLRNMAGATRFNVDLLRDGQVYSVSIPVGKRS